MRKIITNIRNRKSREKGQTALEYALIAGVVAIALIGAVKALIIPMFQEDGEAAKAIKQGIVQAAGGSDGSN